MRRSPILGGLDGWLAGWLLHMMPVCSPDYVPVLVYSSVEFPLRFKAVGCVCILLVR